jgi:ABC-type multidrug transport system permease subunit
MEQFITCAGSITILLIFLGFIYAMRYLNYKETMELAEKGLVKPVRTNGNKGALIWGIIITAIGLALTIGLWPLGMMINTEIPFGFGPWMLAGLLPTFFGLALVLIHVLTREDREDKEAEKEEKVLPETSTKAG